MLYKIVLTLGISSFVVAIFLMLYYSEYFNKKKGKK